jgi:hypothetical protein
LTELRRKGNVTENDKRQYEAYVIETKKLEDNIKTRMDSQLRSLEDPQLQRSVEVVQKRTLLIKLSKDFDRVKASLTVVIAESSTVRVGGNRDDAGSSGGSKNGSGGSGQQQQQQMLLQSQLVQGQDVDQMILEERHRDIVKMNQDLLLVKEMMG